MFVIQFVWQTNLTMGINAQLDDEYADKLAFIQQQTNQAVTDVIKSAIELDYQQFQHEQKKITIAFCSLSVCDFCTPLSRDF